MRQISLIIALLITLIAGGKLSAQSSLLSDAPTSDGWAENTKWYTIKKGESDTYLSTNAMYTDTDGNLMLSNTDTITTPEGYWCVVASGKGVQFYNYYEGTAKVLGIAGTSINGRAKIYDKDNVPDSVITVFYLDSSSYSGDGRPFKIKTAPKGSIYWASTKGYLTLVDLDGSGTFLRHTFFFKEVSSEDIATAKSNIVASYSNDINSAVTTWTPYADKLFCHSTDQINALKATLPTTEPSTYDEKLSAVKAMKAALTTFNASSSFLMPEAGKRYALKDYKYGTYLYMPAQEPGIEGFGFRADSLLHADSLLTMKSQIWTVEENNGNFYIKNCEYGKKLSHVLVNGNKVSYNDSGTAYTLYPNDGGRYNTATIGFDRNSNYRMCLHASNDLWLPITTDEACSWYFVEVSDEDYNKLESVDEVSLYKKWGEVLPVTNDAYTAALAAYNENPSDENFAALKRAVKECAYVRIRNWYVFSRYAGTLGMTSDASPYAFLYSESDPRLIWKLYPVLNGNYTVSIILLNLNAGRCLGSKNGFTNCDVDDATAINFIKTEVNGDEGVFYIQNYDCKYALSLETSAGGSLTRFPVGSLAYWYVFIATSLDVPLTTIGEKAYATVYLPFAVSDVANATAYKGANSADNTRVDMTEVSQLATENGYLLVGEPNDTAKLSLSVEDFTETNNILTGTLTELKLTDATRSQYRVFGRTSANDATTLGFNTPAWYLKNLAANKAFITESSAKTSAANLILSFDGKTDGIDAATLDVPAADAPIYDLSGRRVVKATKGLYIKGGKKILVK